MVFSDNVIYFAPVRLVIFHHKDEEVIVEENKGDKKHEARLTPNVVNLIIRIIWETHKTDVAEDHNAEREEDIENRREDHLHGQLKVQFV